MGRRRPRRGRVDHPVDHEPAGARADADRCPRQRHRASTTRATHTTHTTCATNVTTHVSTSATHATSVTDVTATAHVTGPDAVARGDDSTTAIATAAPGARNATSAPAPGSRPAAGESPDGDHGGASGAKSVERVGGSRGAATGV